MTYIDQCSKCGQSLVRLVRERRPPRVGEDYVTNVSGPLGTSAQLGMFVTSCCKAAPVAVKKTEG